MTQARIRWKRIRFIISRLKNRPIESYKAAKGVGLVLAKLLAHVVAGVPAGIFAQVVLVVPLGAVPR